MAVGMLRDDLLSLPGVESALLDGDAMAPTGVHVHLAPDVDAAAVGDEIKRVLSLHGLRSEVGVNMTAPAATPGEAIIREIGITLAAATASIIGLGFPQAIGVVPTAPVDFIPANSGVTLPTNAVTSAIAWGTKPTIPANFIKRVSFPGTIGTGIIWTFEGNEGIVITPSQTVILWNLDTNAVIDAYAVVEI